MLDSEGLRNYLIAGRHLYMEMSKYAAIPYFKHKYETAADGFLTQILKTLNPNDDEYLLQLLMKHLNNGDFEGALHVSNRWMRLVVCGSHRYAIAAYYRFLIYSKMQKHDETMYWLIISSISDVHNAVMDQGSLWELARLLHSNAVKIERSYRYIRFAWTSAQMFKTRMRNNQISPVLSLIEGNYQEHVAQVNLQLRIIICVVCILCAVVLTLFFYANRQRHKLQTARNELNTSNKELKKLNQQLSEYNEKLNGLNEKLASTNQSLDESNKMKELYIGRFLSLCSTYIDKTETLRRNILTRIKNNDYTGLTRLAQARTDELDDFYRNFDSAFLNLFPDFVSDFNTLLRPEERVHIAPDGSLGTYIRIFACIRLGIDDSSRIAEFLHYSVNTIYNYRAKIKNCALDDRNEFEQKVKKIGMK